MRPAAPGPEETSPDAGAGQALVRFEMAATHVALVTLDRPGKRNAIDPAMAARIETIVRATEADDAVRVVVLASSHDRVFCSGADLGVLSAHKGGGPLGMETAAGGFAGFVYATRRKPWIAAVEGLALAGGCEIAVACDMIVASETARFGLPEVTRGLLANAGGVPRLLQALPRNIACEMIATGEAIDAVAAHRWGLVNRLAPPGLALAAARQLADVIARNAPLAVQHSLAAARASIGQPDGAARVIANDSFHALRLTEDFKEGPRAFMEKRAPVWTGR